MGLIVENTVHWGRLTFNSIPTIAENETSTEEMESLLKEHTNGEIKSSWWFWNEGLGHRFSGINRSLTSRMGGIYISGTNYHLGSQRHMHKPYLSSQLKSASNTRQGFEPLWNSSPMQLMVIHCEVAKLEYEYRSHDSKSSTSYFTPLLPIKWN